jgi:hypothetical protein
MTIIRHPSSPFHARLTPTPDGTLAQLCEDTPASGEFHVLVSEMVKFKPYESVVREMRKILEEST